MGCKQWLPKSPVFLFFLTILIFMIFEFLFYGEYTLFSSDQALSPYDERDEWYESNSTVCDLPFNMDPYDPIIKAFIRPMHGEIKCIKSDDGAYDSLYNLYKGKSLSYMNDNDPIVRIFRIKDYDKSLKCLYQSFDRDGNSDDNLRYSTEKPIIGHKLNLERIGVEFLIIRCYLSGKFVYNNIHSWPSRVPSQFNLTSTSSSFSRLSNSSPTLKSSPSSPSSPLAESKIKDQKNKNSYKPSVMFLIIESMSYLNHKRFMFKTSEALSKLSNNFILKGLNKLADNSYPNMMPILSGYRPYYGEWPFNNSGVDSGPYDEIPFIWSDFKAANYATGYVEDFPSLGLFNYLAHGFKKPPVDWYTRPYWLQMDKEQGIESLTFCYKQKAKIIYWLKQVKQFLNKVNKTKQPFFLWSFYIQVTHKDFNNAQLIDGYIADFVNSYRSILEDTVFILMGDHGNRFGSSMKTGYSQIETRMPLFSIHIPPKLLTKHPHLAHYLKQNEKRLTTWLDVREILKDIVSDDYRPIVTDSNIRNAYSVWREEVPLHRTCQEALIPMEFCLCSRKHSLPVNSKLAQKLSSIIIEQLNNALSKYSNFCYQLSLKEIYSIKNVYVNGQTNNNNSITDRFEVILSVNPSAALFQAQLHRSGSYSNDYDSIDHNDNDTDWLITGDVSRLNSYGNQSICIDDRVLRKYCYCRDKSLHSHGL